MLFEMAGMSCEDGLVMQIHPGVPRNHHDGIAATFGTDRGFDIPAGMRRFRETATETAGFVDDTWAFASIPARHDLSRRIDAGYLATLVAEHRLDEDEAVETALDLAYRLPKQLLPARVVSSRSHLSRSRTVAPPDDRRKSR